MHDHSAVPRNAHIPNPATRSRLPAILQWDAVPPPHPDQGPSFRGLQPRDLALLKLIVEGRYCTIEHAAMIPEFRNYSYAARRLRQFVQYGWLGRGQIPMLATETSATGQITTRRRFHWVYSITEQGLTWMLEIDPDWAQTHDAWVAPAGRPIAAERVQHELDRNTAIQRLGLDPLPDTDPLHWTHGSLGAIRAYPFGLQSDRLHIIPDAVVYDGPHIWFIELERSWRTTTIAKKSHQYATYFHHDLWRQRFWQRPRVLFVLSDSSTQHASWTQWWTHATILRGTTAYLGRLSDLQGGNSPLYHQTTTQPYAVQGTTWAALHTPQSQRSGSVHVSVFPSGD